MISKPASDKARRLVVGSSKGSRPGMAIRLCVQNSGCSTTGSSTRPRVRKQAESPVVWSKWPWLRTMASRSLAARSRRARLSLQPVGREPGVKEHPVHDGALGHGDVQREPVFGGQGASITSPPSRVGAAMVGSLPLRPRMRWAGPSSIKKTSMLLSQMVVIADRVDRLERDDLPLKGCVPDNRT